MTFKFNGLSALALMGALLVLSPGAFSSPDAKTLRPSAWTECLDLLQNPAQYRGQLFLQDLVEWRKIAQRTPIENYMLQIEPTLRSHLRWAKWLNSPTLDELIQTQITRDYEWARDHATDLKRIYDRILMFVTPETRNFPQVAKALGPTEAFKKIWLKRSQLTSNSSEALQWHDLTQMIQSLQPLLKSVSKKNYRTGPAHFILGGSVINGQGRIHSDLDGGALPIHLMSEPEVQTHLKSTQDEVLLQWLKRLDHRLLSSVLNGGHSAMRSALIRGKEQDIWKKPNLWNYVQPFALRVFADRVELMYFKPHFEGARRVRSQIYLLEIQ